MEAHDKLRTDQCVRQWLHSRTTDRSNKFYFKVFYFWTVISCFHMTINIKAVLLFLKFVKKIQERKLGPIFYCQKLKTMVTKAMVNVMSVGTAVVECGFGV